ncbi:FAD-binding oxidoreductase [Pontibacter cellulosilyticus]|uniref:FAD-binding protein n=1 Tax=Pontibacter cellulosilyticus TaxID=1720253 RepID=A0A923N7G6_9BACT|nr:FAD-linked oxidase C-terminal domain-containing protein [Pontibacter cellulosilyticus]MBC5993618.1 FAD-binding protein [Pontibacter cellulosilyticus]
MKFNKLTPDAVAALSAIVGPDHVVLPADADNMYRYTHDETEDLRYQPEIVLKPANAEEISHIMQYCHQNFIPVTPRGAGTGLSGGALAVHEGVILSTERLNSIVEIDERNLQATVEPGVITQVFQEAVIQKGLFYPPDPSSRGSSFLGGNLSESSGGPRAVKYGVTKDYVLNVEVVMPTGEITWTGANVLKNATGYNLTQLMVGSEGTLGIITKIVFKLIPYPPQNLVMLVPFRKEEEACEAVYKMFMAGIVPSALEFMERDAIEWTAKYVNIQVDLPQDIQAHLLIELDGKDKDVLFQEAEQVYQVLDAFDIGEVLVADTEKQKADLWHLRRNVGHAVKSNSIYKEEDTVVPRAELPKLLKGVKEIGVKYNFKSVCYGHAGDGNLHINIVKGNMSDDDWNNKLPEGIKEIFRLCVSLGGTISGEHGIGLVQRPYISIALNEVQLRLMKGIKQLFDPHGILNPGKIF